MEQNPSLVSGDAVRIAARNQELDELTARCEAHWETSLSARERNLVSGIRFRLKARLPITEPQEKWLRDIVRNLPQS